MKSLKEITNNIISKHDGIGVIFIMVQYVEKELLLHLSKIENISYEGAKEFISKNHFEFIVSKFNKLTDKRFGSDFNKDLEKLRRMRNFLVHDSLFGFTNQVSGKASSLNDVFWKFINVADRILAQLRNYTMVIALEDNLSDGDFIYRYVFEKISEDIKEFSTY